MKNCFLHTSVKCRSNKCNQNSSSCDLNFCGSRKKFYWTLQETSNHLHKLKEVRLICSQIPSSAYPRKKDRVTFDAYLAHWGQGLATCKNWSSDHCLEPVTLRSGTRPLQRIPTDCIYCTLPNMFYLAFHSNYYLYTIFLIVHRTIPTRHPMRGTSCCEGDAPAALLLVEFSSC